MARFWLLFGDFYSGDVSLKSSLSAGILSRTQSDAATHHDRGKRAVDNKRASLINLNKVKCRLFFNSFEKMLLCSGLQSPALTFSQSELACNIVLVQAGTW